MAARHVQSLARYPFDSVLLPFNLNFERNDDYRADFEALLAECRAKNVAVQTIKAIARGRWGAGERRYNTWYEPLEAQEDIDAAVAFVLDRPGIFLNTAGDPQSAAPYPGGGRTLLRRGDAALAADHLGGLALRPLFAEGDDI